MVRHLGSASALRWTVVCTNRFDLRVEPQRFRATMGSARRVPRNFSDLQWLSPATGFHGAGSTVLSIDSAGQANCRLSFAGLRRRDPPSSPDQASSGPPAAAASGRKGWPLLGIACLIRAGRAASATIATFLPFLVRFLSSSRRSQAPSRSLRCDSVSRPDRALCTGSERRQGLPCRLMRPSRGRPPVKLSRGVRPSLTTQSGPVSNAFPSSIAATAAVAVGAPAPGMPGPPPGGAALLPGLRLSARPSRCLETEAPFVLRIAS